MAYLVQYCNVCSMALGFEGKPGVRELCFPCNNHLVPWSELKPTTKFMVAWREFGIEKLKPAWKGNQGEQRFDDTQRKIDFSWPDFKVGVEIDGFGPGHLSTPAAGRTFMGTINRDHEKVNDAAVLGWTILRYTSQMIGSRKGAEHAVEQVVNLLEQSIVPTDQL